MQKPKDKFSLAQWLEFLEQRHEQEIQLGLSRVQKVAEAMALVKPSARVITVAGTNGKGSTVAALEAIYHAAGYRVGTYTSPHLLKFNERIKINKQPISDEALCLAFSYIEEARGQTPLSYFEVVTLSALWYYNAQKVDLILLEVGLGGRLDATNIIDSDLAIISTIDFDHQDYLGSTLEAIGFEKAGILRQNKPFVYADRNPPSTILAEAEKKQVPSYLLDKDYRIYEDEDSFSLEFLGETKCFPKPAIQLKAAAAAIVATECLQKLLPLNVDAQRAAMSTVFVPGRLDLRQGETNILYDVSHNPQSANLLAAYLKKREWPGKIHAVFSALIDKDINGLIHPLRDCVDRWYPAQLNNKRAATKEVLADAFAALDINIKAIYASPIEAFLEAKLEIGLEDLIIVYGSFYTVAAIMEKEIQ